VNFDALTLLIETTAAGSLAEAARRLRVSPMKATRLISALEDELGVRLLHRTTRALSLTDDGLAFLPHAKTLLEDRAAALASVQGGGAQPAGLLRLSASLAIGRKVVAPLIVDFMRAWPAVQVDLKLTDTVVDLVAEGIDLAIRIAELRDSDLIARRIADNPRLLVASPAYVGQRGAPVSLSDLGRQECLTGSAMAQWSFSTAQGSRTMKVGGRFTANSIDAVHEACRGGLGIACLSHWDVAADLASGALIEITLDDAALEPLAIWAVYASRHMVPAKVRFFMDALAERLLAGGERV